MARYRTTKCPYCNYAFEYFSPYVKEDVGHPANVCPNCKKIFKTGMKYWFEMDSSEKYIYVLKHSFTALFSGFIYTAGTIAVIIVAFDYFFENTYRQLVPPNLDIVLSICVVLYITFVGLIFRRTKKHIDKYSKSKLKEKLNSALNNKITIDLEDW